MENPVPSTSFSEKTAKPPASAVNVGLMVLLVLAVAAAGWFGYQYFTLLATKPSAETPSAQAQLATINQIDSENSAMPSTESTGSTETAEWVRTKSYLSYEYPKGWHVAELWPYDSGQADGRLTVSIVMGKKPINTAPGDGIQGEFTVNVTNGMTNPNAYFEQQRSNFNSENYTEITSETLQTSAGTIYYYRGKMIGPYMEGTTAESYYLNLPASGGNNDTLNQSVVEGWALHPNQFSEEKSELLRHVMLSIEK